jgi:hypothetical protein
VDALKKYAVNQSRFETKAEEDQDCFIRYRNDVDGTCHVARDHLFLDWIIPLEKVKVDCLGKVFFLLEAICFLLCIGQRGGIWHN